MYNKLRNGYVAGKCIKMVIQNYNFAHMHTCTYVYTQTHTHTRSKERNICMYYRIMYVHTYIIYINNIVYVHNT